MTIRLWNGLDDLNLLVGADFPDADEDALWRCSEAWAGAAVELRRLTPEAAAAGARVLRLLGGDTGAAFAMAWQRYAGDGDGFLDRLADACDQLALACDTAAVEVEYAKIQYVAALVILGATIAALVATVWAGGVSAAGIPLAIAAAQITIRLIIMRLLTAIVLGAGVNVAIDAVAQAVQLSRGHRDDWDWSRTARAAEDGAIFGAVGGGVFLAGGRLAPHLMRTPAGVVAGSGVTGALGGVAAPLAHGETPTARDLLLSMSSGLVGGVGPDVVRGRVPDVSALSALDPARLAALDPTPGQGLPDADRVRYAPSSGAAGEVAAASSGVQPARTPQPGGSAGTTGRRVTDPPELVGAAVIEITPSRPPEVAPPISSAGTPGRPPGVLPASPEGVAATSATGSAPPVLGLTGLPGPSAPGHGGGPAAGPATVSPLVPAASVGPSTVGATSPGPVAGSTAAGSAAAGVAAAAGVGSVGSGPVPTIGSGTGGTAWLAAPLVAGTAALDHSAGLGDASPTPADAGAGAIAGWELSDAEATELVRTNVFTTDAGLAFYAADDDVRAFAEAVNPAPGFVTLDLHGSPRGFQIDDYLISPDQFAGALRALLADGTLVLPEGHGLKLLSCDTATGGPLSPAAQLARALGVDVIAPDLPVWTTLDGEEVVASPVLVDGNFLPADPPDGGWHRFDPDGDEVTVEPGGRPPQTTGVSDRGLPDHAPRTPDLSADAGDYVAGDGADARLLGAGQAVVDGRKITAYALDPTHPLGQNKARVFSAVLGFDQHNADDLIAQVRDGVVANPPVPGVVDRFGHRFSVDIAVTGPRGMAIVRTGWIYETGATAPRLTTLYVR